MIVDKAWGKETWHLNTDRLCLKWLDINAGWRCSTHRHIIKEEGFVVLAGKCVIWIEGKLFEANVGDIFHVPAGALHWFAVPPDELQPCRLLEFSTHHEDSDVERIHESGKFE